MDNISIFIDKIWFFLLLINNEYSQSEIIKATSNNFVWGIVNCKKSLLFLKAPFLPFGASLPPKGAGYYCGTMISLAPIGERDQGLGGRPINQYDLY